MTFVVDSAHFFLSDAFNLIKKMMETEACRQMVPLHFDPTFDCMNSYHVNTHNQDISIIMMA